MPVLFHRGRSYSVITATTSPYSVFADCRLPSALLGYIKDWLTDLMQFYSCGYWHYHSASPHSLKAPFLRGQREAQDVYCYLFLFQMHACSAARDPRPNLSRKQRAISHNTVPLCIHPAAPSLIPASSRPHSRHSAWGSRVLRREPSIGKVEGAGNGGPSSWGLWEHARNSQTYKLLPGSTTDGKYRLSSCVLNLGEIKSHQGLPPNHGIWGKSNWTWIYQLCKTLEQLFVLSRCGNTSKIQTKLMLRA